MTSQKLIHVFLSCLFIFLLVGGWIYWQSKTPVDDTRTDDWVAPKVDGFKLNSPVFADGESIPATYTCDGTNINFPLEWSGVPYKTQELLIVMEDKDVGALPWVHWIVYNVAPVSKQLSEGQIPTEAKLGKNSFETTVYSGPCPPRGEHRYLIKLYALDKVFNFPEGLSWLTVESKIKPHIVGVAELTTTYYRPGS